MCVWVWWVCVCLRIRVAKILQTLKRIEGQTDRKRLSVCRPMLHSNTTSSSSIEAATLVEKVETQIGKWDRESIELVCLASFFRSVFLFVFLFVFFCSFSFFLSSYAPSTLCFCPFFCLCFILDSFFFLVFLIFFVLMNFLFVHSISVFPLYL